MSNYGKSSLGLDANVVAMLCYVANLVCYLGLILSIITIVQDKTNKLARFHAFQSIFWLIANIVVIIPLYIVMFVGVFVDQAIGFPVVSGILMLVMLVYSLAMLFFFIMVSIKAFGGEMYKIPVIGGFAEKYA